MPRSTLVIHARPHQGRRGHLPAATLTHQRPNNHRNPNNGKQSDHPSIFPTLMPSRNTTIRDHHRNRIKRGHPPCGICGQPIDYTLPYLHPGSYVVDHIIPTHITGPAGDTLANKQAAHRSCNRTKSNKLDMPTEPRRYATPRQW